MPSPSLQPVTLHAANIAAAHRPAASLPAPRLASYDTSLATRQGAKKFNKELSFDTSSVTDMSSMFRVRSSRALRSICSRTPSLHAACTTTAPHALSPPGPHLVPFRTPSLSTRQKAGKFNRQLSFDLSSITDMSDMFTVPQKTSSWTLPPAC